MLVQISKPWIFGFAMMTAIVTFEMQSVSAQGVRDKVERNNGGSFFENSRASRGIRHARDYSRSIQQYTTQAPTINPTITKAESEMLGQQIQGVQREMVVIREQNASNPKVVEQVKGIESKLAQAASTQKMLHGECCKDSPNGKVCSEMCSKITSTLDQIEKDHAALLKAMGHEHAAMGHQDAKVDHDQAKLETRTPATPK